MVRPLNGAVQGLPRSGFVHVRHMSGFQGADFFGNILNVSGIFLVLWNHHMWDASQFLKTQQCLQWTSILNIYQGGKCMTDQDRYQQIQLEIQGMT